MSTEQSLERRDFDANAFDEIEIDLLKEAKVLLRNIWLILAAALLFGSAAYLGTKLLIAPTYRSSFTAYVNNRAEQESTTLSSSDITAARSLVSTYAAILTSRAVLTETAEAANLDLDFEEMKDSAINRLVSTETVDDTELIQVNVTMNDPEEAVAYAEAMVEIAPSYITKVVEGSSMQIIDTPSTPHTIYGPSYLRNTVIGIFLGGVLAAIVVVLRDLLDDRVKSVTELEERYGIPVMGIIPDLVAAQKQNFAGYSYAYGKSR